LVGQLRGIETYLSDIRVDYGRGRMVVTTEVVISDLTLEGSLIPLALFRKSSERTEVRRAAGVSWC